MSTSSDNLGQIYVVEKLTTISIMLNWKKLLLSELKMDSLWPATVPRDFMCYIGSNYYLGCESVVAKKLHHDMFLR